MDGTVRVWNLEDGHCRILKGHAEPVWCVGFSPDGKRLASGGPEGAILWNLASRDREAKFARNLIAVAVASDRVATAEYDGTVRLWDFGGKERAKLAGHTAPALAVAFHPAGKRVAFAGPGGLLRVWDVESGRLLLDLKGHPGAVRGVAFSGDGRFLASAGTDVRVWDAQSGKLHRKFETPAQAYTIAVARHGTSLLASCVDNRMRLWAPAGPAGGLEEPPRERAKGFLGVTYANSGGALITAVVAGSQAEACGFQINDVIVGCDERSFGSSDDFLNFMRESSEGQEVYVRIKREGAEKIIKAKLGRWP
jgi:WD40 repeat protein